MNLKHHSQPHVLARYSFLWSEARLVVAAVALFINGMPVLVALFPVPVLYGAIGVILTLSYIISGVASAYLLYRWFMNGKKVFGGRNNGDVAAFFVSVVSGINLGLTGLTNRNPGMSISSNYIVFVIVGLVYLACAWHLWQRWNESGEKIVG